VVPHEGKSYGKVEAGLPTDAARADVLEVSTG